MPDIVAGMRLSLTLALILAVIGEMLSGQEGLGTSILLAARAFRAPELCAGIALLGLIGLVSSHGSCSWSAASSNGGLIMSGLPMARRYRSR